MIDRFGRVIDYMRVSVTDKCNLNCFYCKTGPPKPLCHGDTLSIEQFSAVVKAFCEKGGKKIRITGGEPLVRKGVLTLVENIVSCGADVGMTTNGALLTEYASDLKKAGLKNLNVSLDTIDKDAYRKINGGDLKAVTDGIKLCAKLGFDLKINAVLLKGINDDIYPLAEFAESVGASVRFIELMPFGPTEKYFAQRFISAADTAKKFNLKKAERTGHVTYYDSKIGRIGFITPLSEKFCSSCNRLRLTCTGKVMPCLHSPVTFDLKPYLDDAEKIKEILQEAAWAKQECHRLDEGILQTEEMSSIGG